MPYDPKNIICHTCWQIEQTRRTREEPQDYFRTGTVEVRRFAPQEPVWIDSDGHLHCRDHIPWFFFEGLDGDHDGKACETCGLVPAGPLPGLEIPGLFFPPVFETMIKASSGRIFCSVPHIPPGELREKSWVRVGPCEGCGREIHKHGGQLKNDRPPRLFCSSRCHIHFYDLRKQVRRAEARKRQCIVCNEPFEPLRSNALTCSPACRQKAYRRRASMLRDEARLAFEPSLAMHRGLRFRSPEGSGARLSACLRPTGATRVARGRK